MKKLLFIVIGLLAFSGAAQAQDHDVVAKVDVVLTTGWVPGFGVVYINSLSNHTVEVTYVKDGGSTCPSRPGIACDPMPPKKPTPVLVTPIFIADRRPVDGALTIKLNDFILSEGDGPSPTHPQGGPRYYLEANGVSYPMHTEVSITK